MGLEACDEAGNPIKKPSWILILAYEHRIRRKTLELAQEMNIDLATAGNEDGPR